MNKKRKLSRIGKILIVFLAVFALAGGAVAAGLSTREHVHADPALPGGHGANGNQEPETYTITTTADPTAGGNVTGYGTYLESENVTVTATPSAGYAFVQWEENGAAVSTDASYTFTVQENRTLTAVFEKKAKVTYKIVNGTWADDSTGEKVVWIKKGQENTDIPTGMKAPNTYCNGSWDNDPEGAVITGDTTYTYTYTDRRKPTAVILKSDPNVTIAANGRHNVDYHVVRTDNNNIVYAGYSDVLMNGSKDGQKVLVTGDEIGVLIGGKGGPNGNENYKTYNTIAIYSIFGSKLDIGQHTVEFSFPGNNYYAPSSAVVQVTVTDGMQYNVNLTAEPSAGGTVTGGGTYNANANVTVTATPNAGYEFKHWEENGTVVSTDASYTFTVQENRTLTAVFEPVTVTSIAITLTNYDATDDAPGWVTGDKGKAVATVSPAGALQDVEWSSDHDGVTIDQDGNIEITYSQATSMSPKVTIIATAKDGSGVTATADLEVSSHSHSVTFHPEGGIGSMGAFYTNGTTWSEYDSGRSKDYTLPACRYKAPEGKTFKVWRIGDTEYDPGDTITLTGRCSRTDVYAVWSDLDPTPYNITVQTDGNGTVEATVTKQDGGYETVRSAKQGTKIIPHVVADNGYTFKTVDYSYFNGTETQTVSLVNPRITGVVSFNMPATDVTINATFVKTYRLLDLSVDPGTLSPAFNSDTLEYSVTVAHDVSAIQATATYPEYTDVNGTGWVWQSGDYANRKKTFSHNLDYGINKLALYLFGAAGGGGNTEYYLNVTREPAPGAPKITTALLQDGEENRSYNATLAADNAANAKWSLVSGELPAGLSLSQDGKISGTPTQAETKTFIVKTENSNGYDTKEFTITVRPEPIKTNTTITPVSDAEVNRPFTIEVTLTDKDGNPLSGKQLYVTVNGTALGNIPDTDEHGKVTAIYTPDDNTDLVIAAAYMSSPGDMYNGSTGQVIVNVTESGSVLTLQADKDTYTYGENVIVSGTLTDANGEKIVNEEIKLSVNGTDLLPASPVKTDADGKYTYTIISRPDAGDCKVKAAFEGVAGSIRGSTAETEVNIYKRPVKITADDKICTDLDAAEPLTWTMEDEADNWFKTDRADILLTVTDGDGNTVDPETAEPGIYTVTPSWKTENTNYDATFVSGVVDTTHDWGEWTQTKDPTVDEEGVETRVCSRDPSHIETRPVPRLPVTLTFNIVNGTWDDGSVTTTARAVKGTVLTAGDVPASVPDSGYGVGEWDVDPVGAEVEGEATFTYTYKHYNISYNTGSIGTAPGDETSYWHSTYGVEVLGYPAYMKPAESGDDAYTFDIYNPWYDNPEFNGDPVEYMTEVVRDMILYTKWIGPQKVIESASVNVTASKGDAIPDGQMIDPADLADFYLESPAGADYHIGWVMWENPDGDAAFVPGKTYTVMFALGTSTGENEYSGFFKGHQSAKTGEYTWDVSKAYALTVNGEGANDSIQSVEAYSSMVRYEYTVPEHGLEHVAAKAETCTEDGNTEYWVCTRGSHPCGKYFSDAAGKNEISKEETVVKAKGHDPGDAVKENEKAADCETDGSYDEVVYCKTCKTELSRKQVTVKATGHDWGDWTVTKEPTETEDGVKTKVCSHNPKHIETQGIPATGHAHDLEKVAKKDAGCTTSGMKEHYKCKKCGLLYTDAKGSVQISEEALVIPPAGHTEGEKTKRVIKDATCEEAGSYYEEIHCSVCGELLKDELKTEPALDHDWDEWKETKAAICTTAGEKKRICKRDDSHTETKEIPATGHDWGEWTTIEAATEIKEGKEERVCNSNSEHKETRSIPVTGHVHKLTKVEAKAADCESEGNTEYWICDQGDNHCRHLFADEAGRTEINIEDTVVKATEHKAKDAVKENEIAATCETEGSYDDVIYCEHCNKELSRETKKIKATGHDWDEGVVTTEATCNGKGEKTFTCKHDKLHTRTEEIPAIGHKWGEWTVTKPATCTEKGEEQAVCEHDKSHVETKLIDATGHEPGDVVIENKKEAGCETVGSYDEVVYCEHCNKELSRNRVTVKATGHDWGDWTVTKEPTETEDGVKTCVCKHDSKHVQTKVILATGHVHDLEKIAKKDAGCTTPGMKEHYKCEKCGLLYTDANGSVHISEEALVIPPAGHTEGEKTKRVVKDATCEEEGSYYEEIHCTVCGELLKDELKTEPALDHDWDEWKETKAATCTSAGEKKRICKRDDSHTETKEIPATGHDWGDWTTIEAATEIKEGKEERVCNNNSEHKETRSIPVTGHVHKLTKVEAKAADCESEGNTEYWICDQGDNPCRHLFADEAGRTEINIEDTVVKATEHKAKDAVKENEITATCETEGSYDEAVYCEHCGKELSRETKKIKALGHEWDEGVVTTKPTCNGKGEKTFTCKHDKLHTRTEEIPAIGHKWGEWTVTKPATCTEKGEEQAVCEHDKSHVETKPIDATGHEPGDVVIENKKEAGCETVGSYDEVVYCKTCKTELSRKQVTIKATGHDWGEWKITKAATETEEGTKERICKNDPEHKETQSIPVIGHVHKLTKVEAKAADCDSEGNTEYWICDKGDNPCGHIFADAEGKTEINIKDTVVKATEHKSKDAVRENEVAATCETDGSYDEVVYCEHCNKELSRDRVTVKATGHDWGDWTVTKAATETEDGIETRICKNDQEHKETRKIPAANHVHDIEKIAGKEPGCTASGLKEHYKCKKCGLLYTDAEGNVQINEEALVILPAGHTEGEKTKRVVTEANCEEAGSYYEEIHCSVCGELLKEELMSEPALGHEWDEWKETRAATCTFAGEEKRICKRDDSHVEVKEIPATGHDWNEWKVTTEATETEDGTEERICKNDPDHKESRIIPAKGQDPGPDDNEEKKIYNCIYGNGNVWTKGSGVNSDFTFTRIEDDESTFDHYTELYADDRKLTDAEAVVRSGSLKVSLLPEFLETLAVGDHTLRAEFDDGSAQAGFTVLAKADPGQETEDDPDGGKEKDDPGKQDNGGEKDDPGKQGNSGEQSGTDTNNNNDKKDKEEAKNSNNDSNDSGATKNEATDKNTNVTEGKTVTVRSSNAANTASGSVVVSTYGKSASNAATTGDTNNNYLWLLLLIISAAVITGALAVKRRKTRE